MQSSTNLKKAPRYLSAARASIHTLACAGHCEKQVPSGEELLQAIMGRGGDKTFIPRLWSLIRVFIAALVDNWRKSVQSRYEFKNKFDLSESEIGNITTTQEIRSRLFQLGYRRSQFYGWGKTSSSSPVIQQRALAKELVLALSWLIAENDGFGLAREIAWSKRPSDLLPPWNGDISENELNKYVHQLSGHSSMNESSSMFTSNTHEHAADDTKNSLSGEQLTEVSDICDYCLLKFGQLKHSIHQLQTLSRSRAKVLHQIDEQQQRLATLTMEENNNIDSANQPKKSFQSKNNGSNKKTISSPLSSSPSFQQYQFLSARALYIVKSPSRFKETMNAMTKSCDLAERLIQSKELEPSFWKLILSKMDDDLDIDSGVGNSDATAGGESESDDTTVPTPFEVVGTAYEALKKEIKLKNKLTEELESLYEEICFERRNCDDTVINPPLQNDKCSGGLTLELKSQIEQEVDHELEQFYRPLFSILNHQENNYKSKNSGGGGGGGRGGGEASVVDSCLSLPPHQASSHIISPPKSSPVTPLSSHSPCASDNNLSSKHHREWERTIMKVNFTHNKEKEEEEEALCLKEVHKILQVKARQEQTQMTVLQGALKLMEPHLPDGVRPMKFETVRHRKRREARAMK